MATLGPFEFTKGFSTGYSYASIPKGYAWELMNCRVKSGVIIPRWSQVQTNSAALASGAQSVTGLTTWIDAPNSVTALVAISNAKIYTADATTYTPASAALTFTDRTGAVSISASSALRYTFDSLNGILVIAGNSAAGGVPLKLTAYNANAAVLGGSPPKADCVKVVNNFCFLGRQLNSSTTYSTLNWSNVSDPETWTAANAIDVNKKDGEQIMALGAIGSDLYIFKQSSIWRLSTITQSIAGIVTLGPLQLVIKGTGCCGPLALDNIPNGNIVFVGTDGHFYEFDGSNIYDVSRQPYPGPNAYDTYANIGGLNIALMSTQTAVKTWRGIGEVWISTVPNIAAGGAATFYGAFAYDFVNQIWQGHISDITPTCFTTISMNPYFATPFESNDILFNGSTVGLIFSRGKLNMPTDGSGTNVALRVGTCVELASEASDFVPRSIYFILDKGASNQMSNLTTLGIYVAFDQDTTFVDNLSVNFSFTGTQLNAMGNRIVLPISNITTQGTNLSMPTYLTVEWKAIGTGLGTYSDVFRMAAKFYISDEIER